MVTHWPVRKDIKVTYLFKSLLGKPRLEVDSVPQPWCRQYHVGVKFDGNQQPNSWIEEPDLTMVVASDPASGIWTASPNFAGLKSKPTAVQLVVGNGKGTTFGRAQSQLDATGLSVE